MSSELNHDALINSNAMPIKPALPRSSRGSQTKPAGGRSYVIAALSRSGCESSTPQRAESAARAQYQALNARKISAMWNATTLQPKPSVNAVTMSCVCDGTINPNAHRTNIAKGARAVRKSEIQERITCSAIVREWKLYNRSRLDEAQAQLGPRSLGGFTRSHARFFNSLQKPIFVLSSNRRQPFEALCFWYFFGWNFGVRV